MRRWRSWTSRILVSASTPTRSAPNETTASQARRSPGMGSGVGRAVGPGGVPGVAGGGGRELGALGHPIGLGGLLPPPFGGGPCAAGVRGPAVGTPPLAACSLRERSIGRAAPAQLGLLL